MDLVIHLIKLEHMKLALSVQKIHCSPINTKFKILIQKYSLPVN